MNPRDLTYALTQANSRQQVLESRARAAAAAAGSTSAAPTATSRVVVQTAHGFTAVGQAVRCSGDDTYALAIATTVGAAAVVGVVGQIINDNAFVLVTGGVVTGLSGLTPGASYYLSDASAGGTVTTPPTISVPIFTAISTGIAVLNIGSPASPGFPAISFYNYLPSHGFGIGDVVYMSPSGLFALALGSNEDAANAVGIVTAATSDYFALTVSGLALNVFSGMTAGTRFWISQSTPGALVNTQPVAYGTQFCVSVNATDVLVNPFQARRLSALVGTPVNQVGHGLSVGDIIYRDAGTGSFKKAKADAAATAAVIGVVVESIDADNFVFASAGWMPLSPSPYTPEAIYYLSDTTAGAVTTTPPSNNIVQVFQALDTDGIYIDIRQIASPVDHIAFSVHQPGHGFAVGDVLRNNGSGVYAKAKADTVTTARVVGVVSAVAGIDDFTYTMAGRVSGLSGKVANLIYYLSDATSGAATVTPPVQNPVRVYEAISTTEVLVNIVPLPTRVSTIIVQASHGFSVGDIVRCSGTVTYAKAKADTAANALVAGVVSDVIDTNTFELCFSGYVYGLSSLTAATQYYLSASSAGGRTSTAPNLHPIPVLIALSSTTAIVNVQNYAPTDADIDLSGMTELTSGSGTVSNASAKKYVALILVGGGGGGDTHVTTTTAGYVSNSNSSFSAVQLYVNARGISGSAAAMLVLVLQVDGAGFDYAVGSAGTDGSSPTDGGDSTVTFGGNTFIAGKGKAPSAGVAQSGGGVTVPAKVKRCYAVRGGDGMQPIYITSLASGGAPYPNGPSSPCPFFTTLYGQGGAYFHGVVGGVVAYKFFD